MFTFAVRFEFVSFVSLLGMSAVWFYSICVGRDRCRGSLFRLFRVRLAVLWWFGWLVALLCLLIVLWVYGLLICSCLVCCIGGCYCGFWCMWVWICCF